MIFLFRLKPNDIIRSFQTHVVSFLVPLVNLTLPAADENHRDGCDDDNQTENGGCDNPDVSERLRQLPIELPARGPRRWRRPLVQRVRLNLARQVAIARLDVVVALNARRRRHVVLQRAVDEAIALRGQTAVDVDKVVGAAEAHRVADLHLVADLRQAVGDGRDEADGGVAEEADDAVVAAAPARGAAGVGGVPGEADAGGVVLEGGEAGAEEVVEAQIKGNAFDGNEELVLADEELPVLDVEVPGRRGV